MKEYMGVEVGGETRFPKTLSKVFIDDSKH